MEFDERTLTPPLGVACEVIDRRRSQREAAGVDSVGLPIPRRGWVNERGKKIGEKGKGRKGLREVAREERVKEEAVSVGRITWGIKEA